MSREKGDSPKFFIGEHGIKESIDVNSGVIQISDKPIVATDVQFFKNGELRFDSTNNRLYIRVGDSLVIVGGNFGVVTNYVRVITDDVAYNHIPNMVDLENFNWPVGINEKWWFKIQVWFICETNTIGLPVYQFHGFADTTIEARILQVKDDTSRYVHLVSPSTMEVTAFDSGVASGGVINDILMMHQFEGVITSGGTAGIVRFQWKQLSDSANYVTWKKGCSLVAMKQV